MAVKADLVRGEAGRFARFLAVGAVSAAAYLGTLEAVVRLLGSGAVTGAALAFVAGTAVSYLGNAVFTFQRPLSARTAWRFAAVTLAGFALNLAIAWLLERAGTHHLLIGLVILAIVPAFNFAGHRLFTFRHPGA